MAETPGAKALHDEQCRLIKKTQARLSESIENGGADQRAQLLAKALVDLIAGQTKLAAQLHPATKIER